MPMSLIRGQMFRTVEGKLEVDITLNEPAIRLMHEALKRALNTWAEMNQDSDLLHLCDRFEAAVKLMEEDQKGTAT